MSITNFGGTSSIPSAPNFWESVSRLPPPAAGVTHYDASIGLWFFNGAPSTNNSRSLWIFSGTFYGKKYFNCGNDKSLKQGIQNKANSCTLIGLCNHTKSLSISRIVSRYYSSNDKMSGRVLLWFAECPACSSSEEISGQVISLS